MRDEFLTLMGTKPKVNLYVKGKEILYNAIKWPEEKKPEPEPKSPLEEAKDSFADYYNYILPMLQWDLEMLEPGCIANYVYQFVANYKNLKSAFSKLWNKYSSIQYGRTAVEDKAFEESWESWLADDSAGQKVNRILRKFYGVFSNKKPKKSTDIIYFLEHKVLEYPMHYLQLVKTPFKALSGMEDEYLTLMGLRKSKDNELYIDGERIMIGDRFKIHGSSYRITNIEQYRGLIYVLMGMWSRNFMVTISNFKELVKSGEIYSYTHTKQPLHSLWLEQTFRTIK